MANLLYNIFILPIEIFIRIALESIYALTGSPLLSLVGVSFVVTVASLPLYHLAETWQDAERSIQKILRPKISEFKSVFKGSALNAYLRTLYRQSNYHPIYAVRTSFGLLIQIPFFFAAYHLLSNYQAFDGIETYIFNDLGSPDGLLKVGELSINLMPFIMTGVNLFSASIYGKKIAFREKVQLYVMAVLFLVVLYDSPSALLFYWTFNNTFGLLKNVAYSLLYDKGSLDKNTLSFSQISHPEFISIHRMLSQMWTRWVLSIASIVFLFLVYNVTPIGSGIFFFLLFLFSMTTLVLVLLPFLRLFALGFSRTNLFVALVYLVIYLGGISFVVQWFLDDQPGGSLPHISRHIFIAFLAIDFVRFLSDATVTVLRKFQLIIGTRRGLIFLLVAASFLFQLFITGPFTLLSSGSAGDFERDLFFYVSLIAMLFFNASFLLGVVYYFLSPAKQTIFIYMMCILTSYAIANCFLFPGDYGDMSNFVFEDYSFGANKSIFSNILVLIIIVTATSFVFLTKRTNFLAPIFAICFVSLIVLTITDGYTFNKHNSDFAISQNKELGKAFLFSKKDKNVVVVMLDRFIGGYVPLAFELFPDLEKRFDGFTWYSDSLSDGAFTVVGVPSIMGGWDYYAHEIHHSRTDVPLKQKLDESIRVLPYNFSKAGFDVTVYAAVSDWMNKSNKQHLEKTKIGNLYGKYSKIWNRMQSGARSSNDSNKKLAMFGIFRAAPPFLRSRIYDEGRWNLILESEPEVSGDDTFVYFNESNRSKIAKAINHWSALDLLPEISDVSDESEPQFIYLSSGFTHEPHITNSDLKLSLDGKIRYPVAVYKKFKKNLKSVKHLYTDIAALRLLSDWFEWMKENDVYDNTRIIVVSDHGRSVINPMFKVQQLTFSKRKTHVAFYHNLLLVKDFEKRGKVKRNVEFMTTCDVPYLAMKDIVIGVNPYTKNPIEERKNKYPFIIYHTHWRMSSQKKNKYDIIEKFSVKGNSIFNIKNWQLYNESK